MSEEIYHKRQFLNTDEGLAATQGMVTADHWGVDGSLDLSDCNRVVTLSFSAADDEQLNHALTKLRRLRVAIEGMEGALKSGWRRHLELKRQHDKQSK